MTFLALTSIAACLNLRVSADYWLRKAFDPSRAGGVTEGSDAGADLEHLRHHASHSSATTTALYSRKTLTKTRAVARLRVAHREVQEDQNGG